MTRLSSLEKALGIQLIPDHFSDDVKKWYSKYTCIIAPNGKPIHIIAQDNLSPEKIYRSRSILEHYLTNYEGSDFGDNKAEVANSMANNEACLLLINGRHREDSNDAPLEAAFSQFKNSQDLYEEEITVEGDLAYMTNDYANHRDASFEEILHLVHEYGIGVSCRRESLGVLPEFQAKIKKQTHSAMPEKSCLWGFGKADWIEELDEEGSLTDEYFAAVVDVYYGYWGAFEDSEYGMHGYYKPKYRSDLESIDPVGLSLVESFLHPELTYTAIIDRELEGIFSMKYNESIPYTHKSQYLTKVQLIGNKNVSIEVNSLDNYLRGNEGFNTVKLSGIFSEYEINGDCEKCTVIDKVKDRNGFTEAIGFNALEFEDMTLHLEDLEEE